MKGCSLIMQQSIISFNLNNIKDPIFIFNNKSEWDNSLYSMASFKKEWEAKHRQIGTRRTIGPLVIAYKEPDKFPCVAIQSHFVEIPNGPNEVMYYFIYDFKIETVQDDMTINQQSVPNNVYSN